MAITTAVCTSFKQELAVGTHNFTASTGDTFKMALYSSSATLDSTNTAYTATNEVSGAGYSAGGAAMTSVTPVASGTTIVLDFSDVTFTTVSITARGCMIYNSSKSNKAVAVFDFGSAFTATAANFVVTLPTPDSTNAVIRIA